MQGPLKRPHCSALSLYADGKTRPRKSRKGLPNISQLSARAGPTLHLLALPKAQPKPTLAAAHPRNGEPRSENSPHQAQSVAPPPQSHRRLSKAVESPGCRTEGGLLGRGGCQRASTRRVRGPPAAGRLTLPARGWGCRGGSARQPLLATARTPADRCVLPPAPLSLWSFLQRAALAYQEQGGLAPPQGGRAPGAGSNCQHSPASAQEASGACGPSTPQRVPSLGRRLGSNQKSHQFRFPGRKPSSFSGLS